MCHDSFINVPWLIHKCAMTPSYMCHVSFKCFLRSTLPGFNIHMCDVSHSHVCHDSFIHVPWRIHTCDMTHPYVCQHYSISFTYVTWLIHMCAMTRSLTRSYMCHDASVCVPTLLHTYLKVHSTRCLDSYMWRVSLTRVPWLVHTCAMTHSYLS